MAITDVMGNTQGDMEAGMEMMIRMRKNRGSAQGRDDRYFGEWKEECQEA